MKNILLVISFSIISITARAGFQFGVLCKDSSNAKYLFSDSVQKDNSYPQVTECVFGSCKKSILAISGVTEDLGIMHIGKLFSEVEIVDAKFSKEAGDELTLREVKGTALICGPRKHLTDFL